MRRAASGREHDAFVSCTFSPDEHHFLINVGGGNRGCDFGEEKLYKHPEYVTTFDDSFDSTYGTYVFKVPKKWKADFKKITSGKIKEISPEYQKQIHKIYPKLKEKLIESGIMP